MTRLIIAEKPKMGLEIAEALAKPHKKGQGYIETQEGIVTWCVGHIMRSYQPEEYNPEWKEWNLSALPMLPENWQIKIESSKSAQFKIIKELLTRCDEVINAGDPGREGQLIVDEVLFYLKNKKPVKRILLTSLDKPSVIKAFKNLQDNRDFLPTYEAAVCRGYADWLMGMNATRAYTLLAQKSGYKGVLSVGRVQSPTLAIVVRRDEEIDNFIPHDYYTIIGTFEHKNTPFNTYWKPIDTTPIQYLDSDRRLINKSEAINIVNKIKNKVGIIKDYKETDGKEFAPLPFNLSKLQIYANSKWGMTAKEVLDICQDLYEKHKLLSYPRTEYQHLPTSLFSESKIIVSHIAKSHPHLSNAVNGADLTLKSSAWNDSKIGDHYGLIPTQIEADLSQLNDKAKKIYQTVCERYIAQFYPPCEYKTAVVTVECEMEIFQANGKVILELGWRKIFTNEEELDDKKSKDEDEQVFPEMQQGQNVLCTDSKLNEKKTTPPARYTEGTLLQAMTNVYTLVNDPIQKQKLKDKKGIGTEATRTGIFETLFKRTLLIRDGKKIISSAAGKELIKVLPKKVTDPALTAVWEDAFDKIEEGKMTPILFKQKQNEWVIKLIDEAKNTQIGSISQVASSTNKSKPSYNTNTSSGTAKKTPSKAPKTKGTCPTCGTGVMTEKVAKASGKKFLGCSNWPKCNHVEWPKK